MSHRFSASPDHTNPPADGPPPNQTAEGQLGSEALYRSLFDASPDAIILTDLQTQILMCNRQAAALRGPGSAESLVGRNAFEFIAAEDHARAMENAQRTLQSGSVHSIEYTLVRDDGSRFPAELSAALIVDQGGAPQAFTAVVRDITDRKRAEDALQRQTALYESLLRAQSDFGEGLAILDAEGRFVYVNEALCSIYEYSVEELLAMPSFLTVVAPELVQSLRERFARRVGGETVPEHYELTSMTKAGRRVEGEISIKRINSGDSAQFVVLIRDVSARKHLEAELIQSEKLRSLGVMAAGVAHHINNVLAGVLGQADLLLETAPDENTRQRLETIVQSAQDGASAVHRIKQFAYEQPSETCEQINLARLARDVIDATEPRWKDEASLQGRAIEVAVSAPGSVWTVGVPSELREALTNIVLNAVDALPAGGLISVELSTVGQQAVMRVTDDGIGMSDQVRGRVYDPFFTTKPLGQGTGLGLAITYGIAHRHGGSVEVTSEPGRGTTVELRLPAAPSRHDSDEPTEPLTPLRELRVLVVDDEPVLAEQLHAILTLDQHRVRVCYGGADAISVLREEEFDVVITDLGMPEVNGWGVASEVKARWPGAIVGLITGWAGQAVDLDDRRRSCVDFVIAKPYRVQTVRETLAAAFTQRPGSRG